MSSGKFARDKGQRGEREAIAVLQPVVNEVYKAMAKVPPELARNLSQTRNGGFDIEGLEWIALEIKRHETTQLSQWWAQTKSQAGSERVPVLMWRKNGGKWSVRMFGFLDAGGLRVRCPVDISIDAFLVYFKESLQHRLRTA